MNSRATEQAPFKKLSQHLSEKCPDVKLEDAKKAIIAYREYMINLRNGEGGQSNYCDVCYKRISLLEASRTSPMNFNFVCHEHLKYINWLQLDLARKDAGVKVEDLPMLDIYE